MPTDNLQSDNNEISLQDFFMKLIPNTYNFLENRLPGSALGLVIFAFIGVFGITIFSIQSRDNSQFGLVLASSLIIGGVAVLFGTLIGFLFGFPKSQSSESETQKTIPLNEKISNEQNLSRDHKGLILNSNLNEVSDWLTKILIGLGIANLTKIGEFFTNISKFIAPNFGGGDIGKSFALGLIIYFLILGFLIGYLWTTIIFISSLRQNELEDFLRHKAAFEKHLDDKARGLSDNIQDVKINADSINKEEIQELKESFNKSNSRLGANAYRNYAKLFKGYKVYDYASKAYELAHELAPTDLEALNFAAAIQSKYLKNYQEAKKMYDRALRFDPDFASANYNFACNEARYSIEEGPGNASLAIQYLNKAIELNAKYKELAKRDSKDDGPFKSLRNNQQFKDTIK